MQSVSNAVTKYGGLMQAMNRAKFVRWCDTAEKTFPTGSLVWKFEYDAETEVAISLN